MPSYDRTQVFLPIRIHAGNRWTFIVSAILGLSGLVITWFFVKDLTEEDLAQEVRSLVFTLLGSNLFRIGLLTQWDDGGSGCRAG